MSPATHELSSRIRYILTAALDSPSLSTDTAQTAVEQLNQISPDTKNKQEVEDFLWTLWTVLLGLVKDVPEDDERMGFLITFTKKLKASDKGSVQIWGETSKLWGDLPLFGSVVREEWNLNPIHNGSSDEKEISAWVSINSFIARLHGASIISYSTYAIWSLRSALEEPLESSGQKDSAVSTASVWIAHAGPALYVEAQSPKELDETEKRVLRAGELAKIGPGLNLERWAFWRDRLEQLGSEEDGERAEQVVKKMKDIKQGKL